MWFWCFMLLMNLLMPVMMLGFGKRFAESPPQEINASFGYCTSMSMKNRDTWDFAHRHCGRLWQRWGRALLAGSAIVMLAVVGQGIAVAGIVGGIVCVGQTIVMVGTMISTERALRKRFDCAGHPLGK